MGKSLGNTIDPVQLVQQYGADSVRYYFLKGVEFGKDGDFNEERFVELLNADLAKNLGNLLNRTLKIAHKYCDGCVPSVQVDQLNTDHVLKSKGLLLPKEVSQAYEALAFSQACEMILGLTRAGNKYIDQEAPWSMFKDGKNLEAQQVIYSILESVRLAAYW